MDDICTGCFKPVKGKTECTNCPKTEFISQFSDSDDDWLPPWVPEPVPEPVPIGIVRGGKIDNKSNHTRVGRLRDARSKALEIPTRSVPKKK